VSAALPMLMFALQAGIGSASYSDQEETNMLYTLAIVLLVLWALGLVTSYTLGGFVHILLVVAVVAFLFQLISGRRV
jgi:hypothetical protein